MLGTVEQIGSKVTKDLKKGDRVTGFTHGGQSYISSKAELISQSNAISQAMRYIMKMAPLENMLLAKEIL
jgi:NADPH:quinone reductase-like Zn-dependent oxidoreductase